MTEIKEILEKTQNQDWQEKLIFIAASYKKVIFSSSFSLEDQVITDFIARNNLPIKIFTLDTGRLPKQIYNVWQSTLDKYKIQIDAFYPQAEPLQNFIKENGINPFYESLEMRKSCCFFRKVEPLHRALKGQEIWISGVRKEHSADRGQKDFFEQDNDLQLIKFYPLLEVSEELLWKYIKENNVPYNKLYDLGYKSIGCDPCTRAIGPDEDVRAGRWWWERSGVKECGLHSNKITK